MNELDELELDELEHAVSADLRRALHAVMPTLENPVIESGDDGDRTYGSARPISGGPLAIASAGHSAQPWRLAAAAAAVALLVGGLAVVGSRPEQTAKSGTPSQSLPDTTDGAPGAESTPTTVTADSNTTVAPTTDSLVVREPEVIGLGEPLLGAGLPFDVVPVFELATPEWVKQAVHGTDEQPLGDIDPNMVILVGDQQAMYDAPRVSITVFDASRFDLSDLGDPIKVGATSAAITVFADNPETGLTGSAINLNVPSDDGLAMRVNTTGLNTDQTVEIAEQVEVVDGTPKLVTPDGFRQLGVNQPDVWRSFSYVWGFDDGTPVAEPIVISTPTASETIPQQPTIEVIGSNLGPVSLMGRIGLEVRQNRVVNGIDVAYRPEPNETGRYWIDWLDGDWSYYIIGQNLESEQQFFSLVESLKITDMETFATIDTDLSVVIPGSQNEMAAAILNGLDLTDEQFNQAATVTVPTSIDNYQFELYSGLGCIAAARWLAADALDNDSDKADALAVIEEAIARPDNANELRSWPDLDVVAAGMRSGDADQVGGFGSNDCPSWTT